MSDSMMSALSPMTTAARPPKLCSAATSCGISVICTRPATIQPAKPPAAIATRMRNRLCTPGPNTVTKTATAMPAMPYQTARLALSWFDSPPSDRMNRMAATI